MFLSNVYAQGPKAWEVNRCFVDKNGVKVATLQGFECVFANIVSVAIPFAGIALFVMLLVGGLKLLTAGGDPKANESAKNTLTYAIFGLVLIVGSYLILKFLATFTGIQDLLKFTIPTDLRSI
jgi:hypothetical protein